MAYPEYVNIKNEKYKIKTDYKTALRAFEIIEDENIGDYERALAVIYTMFGFIPELDLQQDFLNMAVKFLQCGETRENQEERERDMDFNFDKGYINASFMSDYRIDLSKCSDMHFWQFVELINGLTDKCVLSRVRQLRNCNPNDYAEKDRREIIQAKESVALPEKYSKEERDAIERFEALFGEGG